MGDTLYNRELKEYFDSLKDSMTPEQIVEKIRANYVPIAKLLHIGKTGIVQNSPASVFQREGLNLDLVFYEAQEGFEDTKVIERYITDDGGECIAYTQAVAGHAFTPEEEEQIRFLMNLQYIIVGRARLLELMRIATNTDRLTGVLNISGLHAKAGMIMARGTLHEYNGIFLNLKNFKYVNKMVSSKQGDEVIRLYAQALDGFMDSDEVCCRLGGDNFFILVLKKHMEEFLRFTESVPVSLEFGGSPKVFHLMARMGIYDIQKTDHIGDVLNHTSIAIGIAKSSVVDDIIWFKPEMLEETVRMKMISSLFPQALKNREFVVYYQPKVTLHDDKLCACEALVRWFRNGELIPPMRFVPVLENEGTICELDFYVFEQVCRDLRAWIDAGIEPVNVSVNFSKIHLHDEQLAETIFDIMRQYDIDSKYIEIELTEMSGYENYEELFNFVEKIRNAGIKTSIDDFGTGYSSLNMLKDLHADIIKLDKSFLDHLQKEDKVQDEIVIKNIVNMINELEMEAIAEGVETKEQADFLRDVNCAMAQGYLYDRPLPHDEFEHRLTGDRYYHIEK